MNITEAYLFQSTKCEYRIQMVWERCDIDDLNDDPDYRLIGTVLYDTEIHKIIGQEDKK